MKIPRKQTVLKYLKPVETDSGISENFFDSDLDLEDSFGHFALQKKDEALLLNRFNPVDVRMMMEKVGLVAYLQSLGFQHLQIEINRDEAQINHLKVYDEEIGPEKLLINLRLSRSRLVPDRRFLEEGFGMEILDIVMIEWLSAQNPHKVFDPERPQLPGQSSPGLGCLSHLMEIIHIIGKTLMIDGFADIPDHFHGAVMYSKKFKFINPAHEGVLQAMLRDLKQYSLQDLSWGMLTGSIIECKSGEPQVYAPSEQIFPISRILKGYFRSAKYYDTFKQVYSSKRYQFDYEAMVKGREKLLQEKYIEDL